MAAPIDSNVDLGFLEKPEPWRLKSHFFPSKVGGKPSWLVLDQLPKLDQTKCSVCGKPSILLLQLYAPVEEIASCFHRTIFIFMCKDPSCCKLNNSASFKVFRAQLSRKNDYYSFEPPEEEENDEDEKHFSADKFQKLCKVCGFPGHKKCGKCHSVSYCSKDHQVIDWKGGHKAICSKAVGKKETEVKYLFPEYEIVIEPEDYKEEHDDDKSEEEKLKEYKDFTKKQSKAVSLADNKDLESMAKSESEEDKIFLQFKQRMNHEPEQVIRYDRGGEPLWISSEQKAPSDSIPYCSCGARRQFEFQVLPQLLGKLDVDSLGASIDWGTLVVYTCQSSCDEGPAYKEEFIWKQDVTD